MVLVEWSLSGKFNAFLNDSFHIGSFRTDDSSCNLEVSLVLDLDIISTSQLVLFLIVLIIDLLRLILVLGSGAVFVHQMPVD